jgi:hypothetical protein
MTIEGLPPRTRRVLQTALEREQERLLRQIQALDQAVQNLSASQG